MIYSYTLSPNELHEFFNIKQQFKKLNLNQQKLNLISQNLHISGDEYFPLLAIKKIDALTMIEKFIGM